MRPTCALCGFRDSIGMTDYEHRTIPACRVCLTPPPDPGHYEPADLLERAEPPSEATRATFATRNTIVEAIRRLGRAATTHDVCHALGVVPGSPHASAVSHALGRMVRRGELHRAWIRPGDPKGGGLYTVPETTAAVRAPQGDVARQKVLEELEERGEVVVKPLAARIGVDASTVIRALASMRSQLRRVRRGRSVAWMREGVPA